MKIKIKVVGIAPLLHDRFPEEDFVDKIKRSKRVKDMTPQEQAERALFVESNKPFIPTNKFWGSMLKVASRFKLSGKLSYYEVIKGGVFINEEKSFLPDKEAKWDIYSRSGVNKNAGKGVRIMIHSPKFDKWSAEFTLESIDDRAEPIILRQILEAAGLYAGIGGWHPRFGRFEVVKFEEVK